MSLENLLKIGQLKTHPPDRDEIQKLLGAAQRGVELVDSVARLRCMNLVLHGIGSDEPGHLLAQRRETLGVRESSAPRT